jgi:Flp pilus assembly protein TadG
MHTSLCEQRRPSGSRRGGAGERGSSTVEFVIGAAVMVLLLMVVVQFALYFHMRAVVTTAARHGVDQARVVDGTTGDAIGATDQFLDQAGGGLEHRGVSASRSTTRATVTVHGEVVSVVPGLHLPVDVTVEAPAERLLP